MTTSENGLHEDWPYDHVDRNEIRATMNWQETKSLRQELERLRQLEDEWSCDLCGENKATATKGGTELCNECIFGENDD